MLHTDGYEAYHCKLPPEITVAGCWAHMRRKFTDTLKSLPTDIRGRSPAQRGLEFCNKLFEWEERYTKQGMSFEQRHLARMKQSEPVAEEFFLWPKMEYDKNPVPKGMLGAVLTYAVWQESRLMNVPCIPLPQGGKIGCSLTHRREQMPAPQLILLWKPQRQMG